MAAPRVAVVGGGVAGTLCSLVLRNRGIHPRLLIQQSDLQHVQAPFWQGSDNPRLVALLSMLEQNGLLAEWKGRFGMLGSNKRGFLPSEIVSATLQRNEQDNDAAKVGWMRDSGDYMGFVSNSREKVYVGMPTMSELLPGIWQQAGIEVLEDARVLSAETVQGGGWRLQTDVEVEDKENDQVYDSLVLASSDPGLGSETVRSIAAQEKEAAASDGQNGEALAIHHRLNQLADALQSISNDDDSASVFILQATFPEQLEVPFDAVSVHGSPILQFMARESSKPGQENQKEHVWSAISTSQFVQHQAAGDDDVNHLLSQEVSRLLSTSDDKQVVPLQLKRHVWRKGAANLQLKEDCVTLAPWRLTICGDFVCQAHATPLDAAALSGLEAGERVAAFFEQ